MAVTVFVQSLDSVMRMELVADKTSEEIAEVCCRLVGW